MMSRKSKIKIMFVMMKLIVLIIIEVHANDNTLVSPAPTKLLEYIMEFKNNSHIIRLLMTYS
jgi:hypothetical protein